jgi:hypothetical protein
MSLTDSRSMWCDRISDIDRLFNALSSDQTLAQTILLTPPLRIPSFRPER